MAGDGVIVTAMAEHPFVEALAPLLDAIGATVVDGDGSDPRDVALAWEGDVVAVIRLPHLDGALERIIQIVERELGAPLAELDRHDKQRAVAMLQERGAFNLRKAVEDVANALQVSRFTVYNYLDRIDAEA